MARLNAENIKNFLYTLNESQIPKKRFNSKIVFSVLKILQSQTIHLQADVCTIKLC